MGGRGAMSSAGTNISRYLGKKGNPMSVEKALETINPNWRNGTEWQYNCQSCTISFEATQRGYDVQAVEHKPNALYFPDENGKEHYWTDVYEGGRRVEVYNEAYYKMKEASKNYDFSKAQEYRKKAIGFYGLEGKTKIFNTSNQIEKEMKSYGEGARATLQVAWKGGGGHIMNVLNSKGQVYVADAQSGKTYTIADVLSRARKGSALTRIDDLKFNSNVQFLTKKGN